MTSLHIMRSSYLHTNFLLCRWTLYNVIYDLQQLCTFHVVSVRLNIAFSVRMLNFLCICVKMLSFPVYIYIYVAVPCRNWRLFRRIFRSHRCVRSAVSLNSHLGRGSYALRRFIRYSCIYEARMSPALNGSSAIRRFKHSDTIEIRDGITLDFYTGLPHIYIYISSCLNC